MLVQLDELAAVLGTNRSELERLRAQAVLDVERLAAADQELRAAYRRHPADARSVSQATRRPDRSGVVAHNDIYWPDLGPPAGRRPICVLTRDAAIEVLTAITCAPISRECEQWG